ncbi:MAG: hypothetical protein LBG31_01675 [Prevotellaceae bacterium]|jgi:hypothetical protein|nr:hypothetical protein [Prevotellaceae bacterium]
MKTIFFFFAMVASIATMATQPEPPVYYTGNNELAASAVYSPQSAVGSENAADTLRPVCPIYYTGNDEPAAFGNFEW